MFKVGAGATTHQTNESMTPNRFIECVGRLEPRARDSAMLPTPKHSLLLHRIDPERNMARFYCLATMPTLFGETSLLRNWGRIGGRGQMLIETFANPIDAQQAMINLATKKGRRGYRRPVSG